MVDDPAGEAPRWDRRLPEGPTTEDEVADAMRDRYGHVLPDDFIDAVAPHVAEIRQGDTDDDEPPGDADGIFEPGGAFSPSPSSAATSQKRDPDETPSFTDTENVSLDLPGAEDDEDDKTASSRRGFLARFR